LPFTKQTHKCWSAAELHQRVFALNPRVAIFDCDGTLWGSDSGSGFMNWSIEHGLLNKSAGEWVATRHAAYHDGHVTEYNICAEMVQIYSGIPESTIRAAAAKYMSSFAPAHYFPEMTSLVSELRRRGVDIWAVSSTNKWVVAEGVRPLGIAEDRILAAEVTVENGRLTGIVVDVPTDESKASALRKVGIIQPDAVFGNSIHDLAMLEIAREAFPINPSPGLLEAAARKGWGYFAPTPIEGAHTVVGGE